MNPSEHPLRVLTVLTMTVSLAFAAVAFGALHTVEGFSHGITGPNCGPLMHNCTFYSQITDVDGTFPNAQAAAGNYHWTGSSWNEQCYIHPPGYVIGTICSGPSGTSPCQKYAWTEARDPQSILLWHGHNPATICA